MRLVEPLARGLRRTDTRAALAIGGVLVLVLILQAFWLYAFSALESFEQADHWVEQTRELVQSLDPKDLSDEAVLEAVHAALPGGRRAARLLGADGALRFSEGDWPKPKRMVKARRDDSPRRGLGSFLLLRTDSFLVDEITLRDGRRLQFAMPLKRFARDTGEVGFQLLMVVLASAAAAFAAAGVVTRRAFAPLREGTALLEDIDASHLGARLPTRSTGDPVDRHAETLNRVLAGIEDSFSRLRSFGSDVAHELRTPLNRMRNVADVALAQGGAPELASAVERIQGSIDELGRTVDALLLIAEVDDRRVPLKPEPLDVDGWLRTTAEVWAPAFEERGAVLAVHAAAGTIDADRALLERVLSNLLDNAMRHGAAGGRVELDARLDEEALVITLDDAGPGVPQHERERIFERFVRLDRSRRGTAGGLGLALARAVARLLGGELSVETSRLGGARFVWRLPRASRS